MIDILASDQFIGLVLLTFFLLCLTVFSVIVRDTLIKAKRDKEAFDYVYWAEIEHGDINYSPDRPFDWKKDAPNDFS